MADLIALIHEDKVFEDETVYLSGNAYYNCKFYRCTLIVREGGVPGMVGCYWECCVWHIDMLVSDNNRWQAFLKTMPPIIEQSLPRALEDGTQGSPSQEQ